MSHALFIPLLRSKFTLSEYNNLKYYCNKTKNASFTYKDYLNFNKCMNKSTTLLVTNPIVFKTHDYMKENAFFFF